MRHALSAKKKKPTVSEQLVKLLTPILNLPEGARVKSQRPGHWQRSNGSWSWHLVCAKGYCLTTGCHSTATELLKHMRKGGEIRVTGCPGSLDKTIYLKGVDYP